MNESLFSVLVADVERDDQQRTWEIPTAWLNHAMQDADASPTEKVGQLTVSLMKHGPQFLVRGTARAQVSLSCARTLEPAIYDLTSEILLILERGTAKKPGHVVPKRLRKAAARTDKLAPKQAPDDRLLTEDDAAFDSFSGDEIELDTFVREHLLLELPMFPLRSDLRSKSLAAIRPPLENAPEKTAVDPRLLPLQALADKIKAAKN